MRPAYRRRHWGIRSEHFFLSRKSLSSSYSASLKSLLIITGGWLLVVFSEYSENRSENSPRWVRGYLHQDAFVMCQLERCQSCMCTPILSFNIGTALSAFREKVSKSVGSMWRKTEDDLTVLHTLSLYQTVCACGISSHLILWIEEQADNPA